MFPDILPEIAIAFSLVLLAHLIGDYLFQTQWMADNKTSRWSPAIWHGITYTIPFLVITLSIPALLVICLTHIIIDRFRLAKYVVWFKNQLVPVKDRYGWDSETNDKVSGYPKRVPAWMSVWLMIIADNTLHLIIGVIAVVWL